jgi:2-dehydro-3-deoxyglucarate aldolase/4-hydroxy-2-oxoheptanedioate aldolase
MRINKIKKKLKNNEPVFGIMIKEARNINIAEILEIAGYDYFVIDMEHAFYDMSDIADILQFARKTDITAVVRIPRLDYAYVAKALDMVPEGIWSPISTRWRRHGKLVRFGSIPEGRRGAAVPVFRQKERAEFKQAADYFRAVNEETLLIAQIESREAIGNVEAITAVEGIDVAMMGTQDLSTWVSRPGNHPSESPPEGRRCLPEKRKASGNHIPDQ